MVSEYVQVNNFQGDGGDGTCFRCQAGSSTSHTCGGYLKRIKPLTQLYETSVQVESL